MAGIKIPDAAQMGGVTVFPVPSGGVCGVFAGAAAADERQALPEAAAGLQQGQPEGEPLRSPPPTLALSDDL